VLLSKNGQGLAGKNDVTAPAHDSAGYYNCELDATDTNTIGALNVVVEGDTGVMPVYHEFQVVEELVYDRMYATDATGADTGSINQAVWQADAARALTAFNHDTGVSSTVWAAAARTLTAFAFDTGVANTVWKESSSTYTGDTGSVGYAQGRLMAVKGDTGAAHLDAGRLGVSATSSLDTGATKDAVWGTLPGTSTRELTGFAFDTGVADTVWKASTSAYTGDTGSVAYAQGRLMAVHGDTGAVHITNGKLATDSGLMAEVVVDALNVDTYAEPGQGTPAATTTLATKIGYLYKAWRNRHTQTASTYSLYNDDGTTVDQKATVSDNGTTFDKTETESGP
jgi:hypothetical protein